MAVAAPPNSPDIFDLRSAALTLVAVVLKTADLSVLAGELDARTADNPGLFDNDPVAVDLSQVRDEAEAIDFPALVALLRRHRMMPVAAKGGSAEQMAAALEAGLVEAPDFAPPVRTPRAEAAAPAPAPEPEIREVVREVIHEVEVIREVRVPAEPVPTMVVDKPLRSGQQVYARGGDLVVLAAVNFGAEVIADGHIHVYAPLRGRALAGARGNTAARIFSTCMEAQLVSVAGIYRTTDVPLPSDIVGQPAQVRLEGEKLVIERLGA
jgi:septum site-determining protein MinC